MSDLPFNITVSRPNYHSFLKNREIGVKSPLESHEVTAGDKWYLIMNQVYAQASKYTLGWYDGSYQPDAEEIPMLIRAERLLSLKPLPANLEAAIGLGYKDVVLYFHQKTLNILRERIDMLREKYGEEFQTSQNIADLLAASIAAIEQYEIET